MILVGSLVEGVERIVYDRADRGCGCCGGGGSWFPGSDGVPGTSGPDESLDTDQDTVCLVVQSPHTFLLVQQQGLGLRRADPFLDLEIVIGFAGGVLVLQEAAAPVRGRPEVWVELADVAASTDPASSGVVQEEGAEAVTWAEIYPGSVA